MKAGTSDLPLLPVFALFALPCGVTSVFAPLDLQKPINFNPEILSRVVRELKVDSSFGSPTLWGKLSSYALEHKMTFPGLKKLLMAGAPVSPEVFRRAGQVCPNADIQTPYGATEALPVTFARAEELAEDLVPAGSGEQGVPVGRPVPGIEVRIAPLTEGRFPDLPAPLPAGVIGEILVSGRNVSPGYLNREHETALSKVYCPNGFYHRMGDVGYLSASGVLYFCGRKAHAVATAERTLYSVPTERIFNAHPKLRRSALIALGPNREPGLAVEPVAEALTRDETRRCAFAAELREIARSNPLTADIDRFFFFNSFPVDGRHNAKIFRDELGRLADRQLARRRKTRSPAQ